MEERFRGSSGQNPNQGYPQQILGKIRAVTEQLHILSLNRQIDACEGLFVENPLIDVAILGQFKAGKSSLINSIIGEPVLPVGVVPVTTVITRLQWGQGKGAVVTFFDGSYQEIDIRNVDEFVSEAKNKANEKNVDVVDITLPSLESYRGLRFVDTPGLGSIFKYNTDISEDWLPEVGAALLAISSDRPLSENDLDLVRELMEFTPRVVLLLTKVDLLSEEQRHEVITFFRDSLRKEFNRDFQILSYSTVRETVTYRRLLDHFLFSLSRNRETEFKGIVTHKIRSLARQCISYLDIAIVTSAKADSDRKNLKKLILDEKINYELTETELSLLVRENMLQTRSLIATYLETTHRVRLIQKLTQQLLDELPRWHGNLWKLTRRFEAWLAENMVTEMDHISRADYKNFFGTLKKAHNSISRSVELFRNLLDRNIEEVLGIKPTSVHWVIDVSEPAHPDVAFTKTFDFNFDVLWFFFPMFIFRPLFEKHFLKQVRRVTDIHLSRLAYQWEVRINKAIGEIAVQALEYVRNELSTIDVLLSQAGEKTNELTFIRGHLAGIIDNLKNTHPSP